MALDKNKIIAEATKLVQKGAYDKAIKTYEKILAEDAKDVRVLLKVGELHQKKGDDRIAADAFKKVADTYSEQGFFLKAVAVYKQIVKLDPDDVRVNERLAGLYQQLGLMSDAMSQYQLMAAALERAGDTGRLVDVVKRMVELDPENVASSIKLGDLYARANDVASALQHLRSAADQLKGQGRSDEYLKVAERISALQGDDAGLARELANLYLSKGDTKRALAKLQLCFKADPKDVETLTLLAQAFRDLGQTSKTASVYKELARVHDERGHAGEARTAWHKVLELVPDDPDAADALGSVAAPPPAPHRAAGPAMAFGGSAPPRNAPPPGPPPGARAGAVIAPPPPPGAALGPAAIPKLLTEADVYVKYGLHEKAVDHLRKVLALDPEHPDALDRLRDLHQLSGRGAEAAEAGARAVRACLALGLEDRARDALARLRELAPSHPLLSELGARGGDGFADEPVLEAEELEPDEPYVSSDTGGDDDAIALAAAMERGDEEIVDDEPPAPAAATVEDEDEDGVELDVEPAPEHASGVRHEPAAPALADELEEAEFFVQQGLLDEARDALHHLLAAYPDHPVVAARLEALRRMEAPPAAVDGFPSVRGEPVHSVRGEPVEPRTNGARATVSEDFDIGRELEDELSGAMPLTSPADDFQYSVEDVFNQFKKGVEQTVRPEDSATHYDLGIAYKEMGLLDDAIHEFEVALHGSDHRKAIDCLSMIGLCNLAKGDPKAAVVAFQRGLRTEGLTREAGKALQFELGSAWEAAGDPQAALYYLQRVLKADPRYRDVAARVQALGNGPGRPPSASDVTAPRAANGAPPPRPPAAPRAPAPHGSTTTPRTPASPSAAPPPGKKNIGYL